MAKPLLIIGNKNYSSWSLRPYMALAGAGIVFEEKLIPFGQPIGNAEFLKKLRRYTKAGLVPVLQHDGLTVWDSLAILEYLAETWPRKNLWPTNKAARAMARSICAEMHSGFRHLRNGFPMNLRRHYKPLVLNDAVLQDVARMEYIFAQARKLYGQDGPFLFGEFSNADAMFAPALTRLETFAIPVSKSTGKYIHAVLGTKAFQKWKADALKETWIVAEDEVD